MKASGVVTSAFAVAELCSSIAAAQSDAYRCCTEYPELNPDFAIQECSAAVQSRSLL
jgi:hypothetical protein